MDWITSNAAYSPELEHCSEILKAFDIFQDSLLSDTTSICFLKADEQSSRLEKGILNEAELSSALEKEQLSHGSVFFFINKYLVKDRNAPLPHDSNKLRVSQRAFQRLSLHYSIPPSFTFALSRYYLPTGRGMREYADSSAGRFINIWYLLPVRVQVPCSNNYRENAPGKESSNAMNPFNPLHLPRPNVDIRGSFIAVTLRVSKTTGSSTCVILNMMHGGWPKVVEEPQKRIAESIRSRQKTPNPETLSFAHLIYLTSALRWWTNVLHSVNEQLIAYEATLQEEMGSNKDTSDDVSARLNRALHSIDAHLHRYRSELSSMEGITLDLASHYATICDGDTANKVSQDFSQVLSQIQATSTFAKELEKKIQNILALLFNRIQTSSDQLLVENGRAMHQILRATQDEARMTHKMADEQMQLAEEMKKDSVAMKTIAVVTMFFLPGASFAALLSMPFFDDNAWLAQTSRLWVWLILTIPSTLLAFAFYMYWRKREERRRSDAQV
ncbi:hypothetical protein BU26DRAFT_518529 [Trematosphaeria pertusa]|uniref:Cora-domain-containing protein n=1 Tax=Trematosphaeria pertusa TaxID=390896 RepID=A0A6A6IHI6_9PLEO|nr:uncharacterized protein BU26DRAFT_518529 [Trematosphaeria pertusa]KAF2250075.1 hypothetical protein BU26DRAFT_518529 [Trematosphaeria pertusa]